MLLAVVVALSASGLPPPDGRIDREMWARVVPLAERLVGSDLADREQARTELLSIGPPAVEGLLVIAKNSPVVQREQVADILWQFGPSAIDLFVRVGSRDNEGYGSPAVMWGLARRSVVRMGKNALPTLEGMFDKGVGSSPFGGFALGVLSEMPPDLALPVLIRLAKHPNADTRKWVVSVIGNSERPEAGDALVVALSDPEPGVRFNAMKGLGRMRDRRAIPILRQQMRTGAWDGVVVALGNMYSPELLLDFAMAARSPQALGRKADQTAEAYGVRNAAVATLMNSGDAASRRVGARYRLPLRLRATDWWVMVLWYGFLMLLSVSAMIMAFGFGGGGEVLENRHRLAVAAVAVLGAFWGGLARVVSGSAETLVLFVGVPIAVWVCRLAGPKPRLALRFPPLVLVAWGLTWLSDLVTTYSFFRVPVLAPLRMELDTATFLALVAAVVVVTWRIAVGHRGKPPFGASAAFRRTCLWGAGAFYLSYAVGQSLLWGGSVEWLKLWLPSNLA